jgi:hypothetical protein
LPRSFVPFRGDVARSRFSLFSSREERDESASSPLLSPPIEDEKKDYHPIQTIPGGRTT